MLFRSQTKLVTPGNGKVAEVPASSAPGDHAAGDASPASATDGAQISPNKVRAFAAGPEMPLVDGKTASDEGVGTPSPGSDPAVSPSPPPSANGSAADASSKSPSGETQMDAVINGKGLPIPIATEPLAHNAYGDEAVPGMPARVPIPRIKPAVPTKAGRRLSTPVVAASSGGLY